MKAAGEIHQETVDDGGLIDAAEVDKTLSKKNKKRKQKVKRGRAAQVRVSKIC